MLRPVSNCSDPQRAAPDSGTIGHENTGKRCRNRTSATPASTKTPASNTATGQKAGTHNVRMARKRIAASRMCTLFSEGHAAAEPVAIRQMEAGLLAPESTGRVGVHFKGPRLSPMHARDDEFGSVLHLGRSLADRDRKPACSGNIQFQCGVCSRSDPQCAREYSATTGRDARTSLEQGAVARDLRTRFGQQNEFRVPHPQDAPDSHGLDVVAIEEVGVIENRGAIHSKLACRLHRANPGDRRGAEGCTTDCGAYNNVSPDDHIQAATT